MQDNIINTTGGVSSDSNWCCLKCQQGSQLSWSLSIGVSLPSCNLINWLVYFQLSLFLSSLYVHDYHFPLPSLIGARSMNIKAAHSSVSHRFRSPTPRRIRHHRKYSQRRIPESPTLLVITATPQLHPDICPISPHCRRWWSR